VIIILQVFVLQHPKYEFLYHRSAPFTFVQTFCLI